MAARGQAAYSLSPEWTTDLRDLSGWGRNSGYDSSAAALKILQVWSDVCDFFLSLFILRDRERVEEAQREGGRERESPAGSAPSVQSP